MKIRVGNKASHDVKCYASGGRVPDDISDDDALPVMGSGSDEPDMPGVDGGKAKPRLDRAGKKGTVVNVIIAGGSKPDAPPPAPMPLPPPAPPMAGPPPPMPPGPPMGGPPMMRKTGGRVMTAGSGSGLGRLQKLGKK
ncbi:MAG TPA: hypothetical protein VHE81_06620 [Lacipirellulaceae bacterium]|nr:hypothetical protein [Lacipirellulaceae bacterium]